MLHLRKQLHYLIFIMNKITHMNKTFALIILVLIIFSCTGNKKDTPQKPTVQKNVRITRVKRDSLSIPVFTVGVLSSKTQSNLSFITGGIIERFFVEEGEFVEKDKLLVRLDMTEIRSRVNQAALGVEKAERDFKRIENLYRDTVATLEQYQDAKTALEVARTNFEIASFNRKNSEIRAPSEGKILRKLKESNEIVASGHPVIVFASTETDWVLKVNLSDRDIVRISKGDSAWVTFDAYPGEIYSAEVSEIATSANLLSGTFEAELRLLDLPEMLVTGLIGNARISPPKETCLLIPAEALAEAMGNTGIVFRIRDGNPVRTRIGIKSITDSNIIITGDLVEGDSVITDGNAWLNEGEEIIVIE